MILALDLGQHLGIAIGDGAAAPHCESLHLPAAKGAMALRMEGRLRSYFRTHKIERVVYERPFIAFRGGKKGQPFSGRANILKHASTAFGQEFILLKICEENGIFVDPDKDAIGVLDARGIAVGKRLVTPRQIRDAMYARGAQPSNDHEADACVIFYAALGAQQCLGLSTKSKKRSRSGTRA